MSRQPTKRENEKFSPICRVHGKTPADCRALISEGRKVGFILSFGTIPSKHCFQQTAPTQSWKNPKPTGSITLIPHGWKVAVDVRGSLYLGEIIYNPSQIPMYRFSRFEGDRILDSSEWFDAPTPAFVQVSSRNPDRKVAGQMDERPNGKLYMAAQYSEPQQVMREEFLRSPPDLPPGAQDLYEQWIVTPTGSPPKVLLTLPRISSGGSVAAIAAALGAGHRESSGGIKASGGPPSSPMMNQPPTVELFSQNKGLPPRHTSSSSSMQAIATSIGSAASPRMIGEPMKLGRKRTSDTISVDFDKMKVSSATSFSPEQEIGQFNSGLSTNKKLVVIKEVVQDVHNRLSVETTKDNELINGYFRPPIVEEEDDDTVIIKDVVKLLRADSMDFLGDDLFANLDRKLSVNMSPEELFSALKHPDSETLTRPEMKRAITTLLQMPIPSSLLNATFDACDVERTGKVTLENFVRAINERENDLRIQFQTIDTDSSGEITLDELRAAKRKGMFYAQERELNALLVAMDRVSAGHSHEHAIDRKIQWQEFRAMMILLPPATTIQTIVDLVKTSLDEEQELQGVEPLILPDTEDMFDYEDDDDGLGRPLFELHLHQTQSAPVIAHGHFPHSYDHQQEQPLTTTATVSMTLSHHYSAPSTLSHPPPNYHHPLSQHQQHPHTFKPPEMVRSASNSSAASGVMSRSAIAANQWSTGQHLNHPVLLRSASNSSQNGTMSGGFSSSSSRQQPPNVASPFRFTPSPPPQAHHQGPAGIGQSNQYPKLVFGRSTSDLGAGDLTFMSDGNRMVSPSPDPFNDDSFFAAQLSGWNN